jgi:hypothetical protein
MSTPTGWGMATTAHPDRRAGHSAAAHMGTRTNAGARALPSSGRPREALP